MTINFGRYQDSWFGEVRLCPSADALTFASQSSPRFKGKLMDKFNATDAEAIAVLWDDKALDADAIIVPAESLAARDAVVQRFSVKPLGESDFDFGAMHFWRIGVCE